ncbi:MAG: transcription-repair coupling factor, partial [Acetobacteraceae bacterium]|nr:transcription-repair coupling factor [Acetobacteraceae bacterium]
MSLLHVHGAPEGFDAVLLARRQTEFSGPLLHVARDDARMARIAEALAFFAPGVEILQFPAWDCLPYDRVSPAAELVAARIATLSRLLAEPGASRIVLTTVNALVQKIPPRAVFDGASLNLAVGGTIKSDALARFLEANGYGRAGTVMEAGEFAMRGGIIDIFPSGLEAPVRLDLFGDEIESIRNLDAATQRSGAKLASVSLRPVSEVFLDRDSIARFRTGWRDLFSQAAAQDQIYLSISEGRRHPGMEHWVPLFHESMETLLDYLPGASVSFDHQADAVLSARLEMIADHYAARQAMPRDGEAAYRPLPARLLYLDRTSWEAMLAPCPQFGFSPFSATDEGMEAGGRPGPIFAASTGGHGVGVFGELAAQRDRWQRDGKRLVVAAWTEGSRERIGNLLREHGFATAHANSPIEIRAVPLGTAVLVVLGIERGFVADDLAVVSEQDLLGERISRPARRRKRADQFIAEATEIAEGDLVVHQDHGIGRYDGLVTLHVSGAPHDCLRLLYDGNDKLFLPVENIEILSRFGTETAGVGLDKLGGAGWQARKARMKSRIRDMAGELIRIAAARALREAEV